MSSLALKQLLDEISDRTFNAKEIRFGIVNRQSQALIVHVNDLITQFQINLKREYKLSPDQVAALAGVIKKKFAVASFALRRVAKTGSKTREVIFKGMDEFIVMDYGEKSNYNAIYDWLMRAGKPAYEAFWTPILKGVKEFLIAENKRINQINITKGEFAGQTRDALQASDLFNLGHFQGSNIHYALFSKFMGVMTPETEADIMSVIKTAPVETSPFNEEENIFMNIASKFSSARPPDGDYKKVITLKIEDLKENQAKGRTEETSIRPLVIEHVRKVLAGIRAVDWVNQEASDSILNVTRKVLINEAIEAGAKGTKEALRLEPGQASKNNRVKYKQRRAKLAISAGPGTGRQKQTVEATPSYLSLITLINQRLPPQVRSNMGSPRLNNRTGRLSESARVTNITTTPQGYPSIEYTYQRSPYDVFDKTLGKKPWNTPERDPSDLVGMSVRQLATELGIRRFYTRRAA